MKKGKNSFEFNLLTKEELDKRFEKIKRESTVDKTPLEISKIIKKHTINRLIFGHTIDLNNQLELFRVTIPFEGFDCLKTSSFSYPPENLSKIGRANIKGFPVLYCSESQKTAVKEMKDILKIGDEFYVSCWKLDPKNKLFLHNLMHNNTVLKENGLRRYLADSMKLKVNELSEGLKSLPDSYRDSITYMNQKFGDLFSLSGNEYYHLTSVYAHEILYNLSSVISQKPIIMFPSQANIGEGINFAFPPDLVKQEHIVPVWVLKVKYINNNNNGNIQVAISDRGIINGNNVLWKKVKYRIKKINFESLVIRTYNNCMLKGKEAAETTLLNSYIKVAQLCEFEVTKYIKEKDNVVYSDLVEIEVIHKNKIISIEMEHGKEIITKNGVSCIKNIKVEVSWDTGFLD